MIIIITPTPLIMCIATGKSFGASGAYETYLVALNLGPLAGLLISITCILETPSAGFFSIKEKQVTD